MRELTDDDILELADQLARELDLDEDGRNVITLRVQRMVWPPNPHYFLHDRPHVEVEIGPTAGELRCPGCGRKWRVNQAPGQEAVWDALTQAHEEYRSGRIRSESVPAFAPLGRRLNLATLTGRAATVEVHDERWTG